MTIVADSYLFVVGVDTHTRTHTFAILDTHTNAVTKTDTFPTTEAGIRRALTWITRHTHHQPLVVIEGIGSYGAHLATTATHQGYTVVEPMPIPAAARHGHGKTDPMDAIWIARSVLGTDTTKLRYPRDDHGIRAALRVLIVARDHISTERTRSINALTALVRTINLGIDARQRLTPTQIRHISTWRHRDEPLAHATARHEAIRLATRILTMDHELKDNHTHIHTLIRTSPAACLLHHIGIGPISAATIYLAWSHPGRIHSEAGFANMAGTAPIPASSGNTTRHRLNRGGDRRLNQAINTIAITRLRCDPQTRAYHHKRLAQGLTSKEIRRILKRYITRQIYRTLEHQPA